MVGREGAVVRLVAEIVEHGAHFDSLPCLLPEQAEEEGGYGVVAEVEVFEVHVVARPAYVGKEELEFLVPAEDEAHAVAVRGLYAVADEVARQERVGAQGGGVGGGDSGGLRGAEREECGAKEEKCRVFLEKLQGFHEKVLGVFWRCKSTIFGGPAKVFRKQEVPPGEFCRPPSGTIPKK